MLRALQHQWSLFPFLLVGSLSPLGATTAGKCDTFTAGSRSGTRWGRARAILRVLLDGLASALLAMAMWSGGKRWSWQSRWQFLATMALADLTFRRSKGVFWRPGCFQIFVKNLDGKRGSCITEAVTARCKRGH